MSKKTQKAKDKLKAERVLRNKIEEKRKERELYRSNREVQKMLNRALSGASIQTYEKTIIVEE